MIQCGCCLQTNTYFRYNQPIKCITLPICFCYVIFFHIEIIMDLNYGFTYRNYKEDANQK